MNGQTLNIVSYTYYKDGSWEVSQGKSFFKNNGYTVAFHADSTVKLIVPLKDDKMNGSYQSFYKNKNRQCVCYYNEGKREGQQAMYWENGQLYTRDEYRTGLLWNIFERYHANGEKQDIGTFKDGNGALKIYNDDTRKLIKIEYYKNGKRTKTDKIKG